MKQYAGCGKNFAYVYVWESFRANHSWVIAAWINTTPGTALGSRQSTGAEVWSLGTNTLSACTRGIGHLESGTQAYEAATEIRC